MSNRVKFKTPQALQAFERAWDATWDEPFRASLRDGKMSLSGLTLTFDKEMAPDVEETVAASLVGGSYVYESWKDRLKGGEADDKSPSDFPKKKLASGAAHEREHTDDPHLGKEIAMDHLVDDPDYYEKLAAVEEGVSLVSLFEAPRKRKKKKVRQSGLPAVFWWGMGRDDGPPPESEAPAGDGPAEGAEEIDEAVVLDKTADKIAAHIRDAARDHRDVRLVFPSRKVRDGFVDVMKQQGLRYGKDVTREPEDEVASADAGTLVSKNLVDRLARALEAYGGGTEMPREMQAPTRPSFYRRGR